MDSAFTARFRLIPNKKRKSGNDCDRYLIIDFTPEDAKDAAKDAAADAKEGAKDAAKEVKAAVNETAEAAAIMLESNVHQLF